MPQRPPQSFFKYNSTPNVELDAARKYEDERAAHYNHLASQSLYTNRDNIRRLPSFRKNLPMNGPSEADIENFANDLDRENFKEASEGVGTEIDKVVADVEGTPEWWAAFRTDFKEPGSDAHTEYDKTYYGSDNEDFDKNDFSDARLSPFGG